MPACKENMNKDKGQMNSSVFANERNMEEKKNGKGRKKVKDTYGEHTRVAECLKILGT